MKRQAPLRHSSPQLEPLDTSEAERLLHEAMELLVPLVSKDTHHLIGFACTEIDVALESLEMRKRFEQHDRHKAGLT